MTQREIAERAWRSALSLTGITFSEWWTDFRTEQRNEATVNRSESAKRAWELRRRRVSK